LIRQVARPRGHRRRTEIIISNLRDDVDARGFSEGDAARPITASQPPGRARTLAELRAATLARQQAYAELVGFYREREIQRARAAERDPSAALH
jgi:hypothetical protein